MWEEAARIRALRFQLFPRSQRRPGAQVTPGSRSQRAEHPAAPQQTVVTQILSLLGSPTPAQVLLALGLTIRYLPPLSAFFRT